MQTLLEESYFLPPTNSCLPKTSIPFPLFYPHGNVTNQRWGVLFYNFPRLAHFTVTKNALQIMSLAAYASETNQVNLKFTVTQKLGY